MQYLEKKVVTDQETIKIKPEKNPILLIMKWVWGVLGCWLFLIPTISAIKATIVYCTTEYLVTDRKVMSKHGWVATRTNEMPLTKIENIVVSYTFWGKIFNYGTVVFQGANHNNIVFRNVKDAESIKKRTNELF